MKSSSVCRVEGDGDGESLCLPMLEGKGDLNVDGAAKGFGEGGTGTFVDGEDEDAKAGVVNHVEGRFSPFVRGTRKVLLDDEKEGWSAECCIVDMKN